MLSRAALLFLSRQRWLRRWAENSKLARRPVSRFIAGTTVAEAIAAVRALSADGLLATLDHLGENVTSLAQAEHSLASALGALDALAAAQLPTASISIKLTQFGLDLSETECLRLVSALAARARAADRRIEIDMESTAYTDRTLRLVENLHSQFGNVRAVIQAYLFRSEADIDDLNQRGISVRLCKGAYLEPSDVALADKAAVDRNYVSLAGRLLDHGVYPAVASHDPSMIDAVLRFVESRRFTPDRFEFQMLYGIRRDLQRDLVRRGFRVRVYVPYGEAWYPYLMRRLAERPANVWFVLKNLGQ